jgi:hypothetical protein
MRRPHDIPDIQDGLVQLHLLQEVVSKDNPHTAHVAADSSTDYHLVADPVLVVFDSGNNPVHYHHPLQVVYHDVVYRDRLLPGTKMVVVVVDNFVVADCVAVVGTAVDAVDVVVAGVVDDSAAHRKVSSEGAGRSGSLTP